MAKITKTSRDYCRQCKYSITCGSYDSGNAIMCMYIVETGRFRGCEIGECDKFEPKKGSKKNIW